MILRVTVDEHTICSVNLAQTCEDIGFISLQTAIGILSCGVSVLSRRGPAPAVIANVGYFCGLTAFAFTPVEARCVAHDALRIPAVDPAPSTGETDSGVTLSGDTLGFGLKKSASVVETHV